MIMCHQKYIPKLHTFLCAAHNNGRGVTLLKLKTICGSHNAEQEKETEVIQIIKKIVKMIQTMPVASNPQSANI